MFEAHSTDYQSALALSALVQGGLAILKVGPGLTFALRETLYGLDLIAGEIEPGYTAQTLPRAIEGLMQQDPGDWAAYCHGSATDQRLQRHFGYSDRIRYYWTRPQAQATAAALFNALQGQRIPLTLISQYLPRLISAEPSAPALALAAVRVALDSYSTACAQG